MKKEISRDLEINVKNRSHTDVTLLNKFPHDPVRTIQAGGEILMTFGELKDFYQISKGSAWMVENALQIVGKSEDEVKEIMNVLTRKKVEPEYFYSEEEILTMLKENDLDGIADAMDFAPSGVVDLIADYAVELPITDTKMMKIISKRTDFDIQERIAISQKQKARDEDLDNNDGDSSKRTTRRKATTTEEDGTKRRRKTTKTSETKTENE